MDSLPDYYFRIRDPGAVVFRLDKGLRENRLDLERIAVVNVNNGVIKAANNYELTERDTTEIKNWLQERRILLEKRQLDDVRKVIESLNQVTHWLQSSATDNQIETFSDALLLAMHDTRAMLVRKRVKQLGPDEDD